MIFYTEVINIEVQSDNYAWASITSDACFQYFNGGFTGCFRGIGNNEYVSNAIDHVDCSLCLMDYAYALDIFSFKP